MKKVAQCNAVVFKLSPVGLQRSSEVLQGCVGLGLSFRSCIPIITSFFFFTALCAQVFFKMGFFFFFGLQATSVTDTTAHGNSGSLTH